MTYFTEEEKSKSIFHLLIKDEFDLIGMMAYTKYKQSKAEYIEKHRISKNNEKPSDEELKRFQIALCEDEAIEKFRAIGQKQMLEIFNNMFKDKVLELNRDLVEKQKKLEQESQALKISKEQLSKKEVDLKGIEKEYKLREKDLSKRETHCKAVKPRGFWNGVLQSIIASILVLVVTVLVSVSILLNTDLVETISKMIVK